MYTDKENIPRSREYGLLSELQHQSRIEAKLVKHEETGLSCTTILQRPREDQRGFCTRGCSKGEQNETKRTNCAPYEWKRSRSRSLSWLFFGVRYIIYASRRGVQNQNPRHFQHCRDTNMSLMYGKEKDDETGIRVLILGCLYPEAY
jgi:hypothetical protein